MSGKSNRRRNLLNWPGMITIRSSDCISALLPELSELPNPFEWHWLLNFGSLEAIKKYSLKFIFCWKGECTSKVSRLYSLLVLPLSAKRIFIYHLLTNYSQSVLPIMPCRLCKRVCPNTRGVIVQSAELTRMFRL